MYKSGHQKVSIKKNLFQIIDRNMKLLNSFLSRASLALKPFNQFCLACTGINVEPQLSFRNFAGLTVSDLDAHNVL